MSRLEIRVSFDDILAGRAYIRIPPEGKIKLAHMAGAPWNDKIPDAELHDLQQEVLMRPEREKIVHGASRLGKSVLGASEVICELMLPNSKTAVVAARYDHVGAEFQYVWRGMRKLFKDTPQAFQRLVFRNQSTAHEYDCFTIWGSRAQGFSVDSDEGAALLGREFSRVILGEGSHISKDILERRILRALDGWLMQSKDGMVREGGYLSIYTTPKGFEGCSAAEYERVLKETKGTPEQLHYGNVPFASTVWIREADILENPYFDREVYETRKQQLSSHAFAEQYQGKMAVATGAIYKSFVLGRHSRPFEYMTRDIKQMRLGVGIDTGAYTGMSLCGIGKDRRKYILGETYTSQMTTTETVADFKEMMVERLGPIYGTTEFDSLKQLIDIWVIDPASQHKLEYMEELGDDIALTIPIALSGGKLELIPSIELVEDWFRHDQLFVADDLDWTLDQIRKYVWKQRKAGGRGKSAPVVVEPNKEYDHLCDAFRFVLVTLDSMGPLEEPQAAVSWVEEWEQAQRESIMGPLRNAMENADLLDRSMLIGDL